MKIHPTAVISPSAEIGADVQIGAYSCIGDNVSIGGGTVVHSHVVVEGSCRIGKDNVISAFAVIGSSPQDTGYRGEDTRVVIGDGNVLREYVSIHRATTKEERVTRVGSHNYFMAGSHVAHDCVVGNHVIMANGVALGGHVEVEDYANFGGHSAVHQFCRIGAYSFIGGNAGIERDVPPFMLAVGSRAKLYGLNRKGLARHGIAPEVIDVLKRAYRMIWKEGGSFQKGVDRARRELPQSPELDMLFRFLEGSKRGVLH